MGSESDVDLFLVYNKTMKEEILENSKVYDKDGNLVGKCIKLTDDQGNVTIKIPVINMTGKAKGEQ